MVITKDTYIVMTSEYYVKHMNADKPNGFPEWFLIDIDNVKDTKSLDSNDKVWFISPINIPTGLLVEKKNDNFIIDN